MCTVMPTSRQMYAHGHTRTHCMPRSGKADSGSVCLAYICLYSHLWEDSGLEWRGEEVLDPLCESLFLAQCEGKCVTGPLITRRDLLRRHHLFKPCSPFLFFNYLYTEMHRHTHSIVESLTGFLLLNRESFRKGVLSNTSVTVKCIWAWKPSQHSD